MLFGPEGFREAPANHRLVIVMGASPEDFFSAIDESLGLVAQVTQLESDPGFDRLLFEELIRTRGEREQIDELIKDVERDLQPEAN